MAFNIFKMRQRFEVDLRNINEVAKDDLKLEADSEKDNDEEKIKNISDVLNWHLVKIAEKQHTDVDVQREIYEIQKNKQEIMQKLKKDLSCVDDPDCNIEGENKNRTAYYDNEKNFFVYTDDNGEKWLATFGEIVTDMNWGIVYDLDKKTTSRKFLKKYLVERAKKEIFELLDSQIIKSEISGDFSDHFKKKAYNALRYEKMTGVINERWGFISEKMVKSFLVKLSLDIDLPFTIKEADVFQDVEQKIDFIIHRKTKNRGVGVETKEDVRDIGVQFTVNPMAREKKITQVNKSVQTLRSNNENIQDIALVIFPLNMAVDLKNAWEESGRPSGGPDRYIEKKQAQFLFKTLLKDIFNPEEISEYWEKVEKNFS